MAETGALIGLSLAVVATTLITGSFWLLAVIYLIPERIAIVLLGWWFDWLPHHGLEDTQSENRYRATRNRVGLEWLLTPLMLSQNYHLVHHLHPSIPFYRYIKTWRRNEEAYLERDAAISTAFGKSLNPHEFREWKQLNRKLLKVLPVRMPTGSSAPHRRVSPACRSRPSTRSPPDSTLVTFARARGAARPVPVRARAARDRQEPTLGGGRGQAQLLDLRACDARDAADRGQAHPRRRVLDIRRRAAEGRRRARGDDPDRPASVRRSIRSTASTTSAIAVGSGITPILSILQTALELETDSRFTLIYGNRSARVDDVPLRARRARVPLR